MHRVIRSLHLFEDILLVTVLFSMIGLYLLEIVLRNFFGESLVWVQPLLQNGVLWLALLGTMVASRRDEQIRIDVASHYLPESVQRWLSVVIDLVTAGICLVVAWYSASFVYESATMGFGGHVFGSLPAWVLQAIIPLGFISIGLRYLVLFGLNLLGRRPDFEEEAA